MIVNCAHYSVRMNEKVIAPKVPLTRVIVMPTMSADAISL